MPRQTKVGTEGEDKSKRDEARREEKRQKMPIPKKYARVNVVDRERGLHDV
jgi:hypothetical protein